MTAPCCCVIRPCPNAIGQKYPALASLPATPVGGFSNPLDGTVDFIAVVPVRTTRLMLAVTREAAAALRPWRNETIRVAVRTFIIALLGALTISTLLRQLRRVAAGEQALRESEERYALAMEGANEGYFDWDVASDRLFLSPKMKTLDGRSEASEIGSRADWMRQIIMHPDDTARFEATLKDHLEGRAARFDCEYPNPSSERRVALLLARGRCFARLDRQTAPVPRLRNGM